MEARIPHTGAVKVAADTGHDRFALHAPRVALLLAVALITYVLFPTSAAVDSPIFEIGSVATQNVIAPFGFTVPKSFTDLHEEREQLARSAKPISTRYLRMSWLPKAASPGRPAGRAPPAAWATSSAP